MDAPKGLRTPGRAIGLVPVIIVAVLVAAVAVFAISHLAVKGPGPHQADTAAQVATGQTPPTRGPYNEADFSEPPAR
jgi:hypothetical protein